MYDTRGTGSSPLAGAFFILICPPQGPRLRRNSLRHMDEKRGASRTPKCGFRGGVLSSCYDLSHKFLDPPSLSLSLFSHSWVAVHEPQPSFWRFRSRVIDVAGQIFPPARYLWTYLCDALPQHTDGTFVCLTWFRRPSHAHTVGGGQNRQRLTLRSYLRARVVCSILVDPR